MRKLFLIVANYAGRQKGRFLRWQAEGRTLLPAHHFAGGPILRLILSLGILGACLLLASEGILSHPWGIVAGVASGILLAMLWGEVRTRRFHEQLAAAAREIEQFRVLVASREGELSQKTAEVRRLRSRLETLYETIPDIVVEVDRNYVFIAANSAAFRFYGPNLIGREAKEFFFYPQPVYPRSECLLTGEVQALYLKDWLRRQDGACRLIAWHARAIRDENGMIVGILGVGRDVTENRELEAQTQAKDELFKAISSAAQDAVIILDHLGRTTFWNDAATRIFGFSAEEVIGKELHPIICPPELLPAYNKGFTLFARTGQGSVVGTTLQLEAIRKDKTRVPVELSVGAFRLNGCHNAVAVVRDISRLKRLEGELKQREQKFRLVAQQFRDSLIWSADLSARIEFVNSAVLNYLGFEPDALVGQHLSALMAAESCERLMKTLQDNGNQEYGFSPNLVLDVEYRTTDGSLERGLLHVWVIQGQQEGTGSILGVSRILESCQHITDGDGNDHRAVPFGESLVASASYCTEPEMIAH